MKNSAIPFVIISLLLAAVPACNPSGEASPTPDAQATIDAAVAGTMTANENTQATIDAAVAATVAATDDAQPMEASTPTPIPEVNASDLGEEELAEAVNEAIAEADELTEETASAASAAAADDTITQEELEELATYADEAEAAIAHAEALIDAYYGSPYAELAVETLELLVAIEEDLAMMADDVEALNALLADVDEFLTQGLDVSEETLDQLEEAAQAALDRAADIQEQNADWLQKLKSEIESRVTGALDVPADSIAVDRKDAIQSALDYAAAVRAALEDQVLSQSEMTDVAQMGANAVASLEAIGGPALLELATAIDDLTAMLAGGQISQATAALGELDALLDALPPGLTRP